ncbi:hypothetical protein D8674_009953 [Pyrus ussuriensis x Pyrus communis]|uniref:Uncharacterized protein n=1 Tax=Pyrus ussuriensis x Pyrus communis TaxID=2448454 RepID=A0A5N5FEL7_9ROSA|nr:hypothetical protein D8674_009953 [Pyrus ussuriensis x Pyrus communis]
MDNEGSDLILFFPLSPVQPLFLLHFWWVSGFCGDRQRSTVSGLRVLLDFRRFH